MLKSTIATDAEIERTGLYFRVYNPHKASPPVIFIVHGRTGTAEVMWGFSRVFQSHDPLVLAPQAQLTDQLGGFSWWNVPTSIPTESAKPKVSDAELEEAVNRLKHFIEASVALYGADRGQIYGMGFSQGAALLGALSIESPNLFKGVALLAGFIPRRCFDGKEETLTTDYFIGHGTEDETVALDRAELTRDGLIQRGAKVEFVTDPVGHKVGTAALRALTRWFDRHLSAVD